MWITRDHYNWLLNVNPNERVASVCHQKDLVVARLQSENYMLYEKIGEHAATILRMERRLSDTELRYIALVERVLGTEGVTLKEAEEATGIPIVDA